MDRSWSRIGCHGPLSDTPKLKCSRTVTSLVDVIDVFEAGAFEIPSHVHEHWFAIIIYTFLNQKLAIISNQHFSKLSAGPCCSFLLASCPPCSKFPLSCHHSITAHWPLVDDELDSDSKTGQQVALCNFCATCSYATSLRSRSSSVCIT